jgi:DNA repair protein RadC
MNSLKTTYSSIINERIEKYGTDALMVEELLHILTGIPLDDAKKSIDSFGLNELINFSASLHLTKSQLKKLRLLYQFVKKISTAKFRDKHLLNSSSVIGEFFVQEMQFLNIEIFMIALLNSQNRLISLETVNTGTINEANIYPREVVKLVLEKNANSVILAHFHPGGSLTPSNADIEVTRKLKEALNTISVNIVDHIIVAEDKYTSFAEKGIL